MPPRGNCRVSGVQKVCNTPWMGFLPVQVPSCLRIARGLFAPGWAVLEMVLQLCLCRRIPWDAARRFLPGHALLLTVRCQHKIRAVHIRHQEWLNLYLGLQTSTVPNSHMALGFLVLPPFILSFIYILPIPGKATSARTCLALLPASVVVLSSFTWYTCIF